MPAHKPHSPSYSLNDLVLVTAFVEFVLSMTAAGFMRYHRGMATDIICVLGIALDARGSIVEWIHDRKQKKKLHEMLRKGDARRATNSTLNTDSAQISVTEPVDGVAARNRKDGHANVDEAVLAANPLTTTNTNMPSSICIRSTYSSASGESEMLSQTKEWRARGQNQESVPAAKEDGVKLELQQPAPALTQEKMKTKTGPITTYIHSPTMPILSDASLSKEAKGINEEPVSIHPTIEVERHKGDQTGATLPASSRTRPGTIAIGNDTEYNKQAEIWTKTAENLLTAGAISLVLAASSTLSGALDGSLSSQADDYPILCPTTTKAGIQEFVEAPQSVLDDAAVGSDCYEATHLLTKTNTNKTGDGLSPIASDNTLVTKSSVGCYSERGTIAQNDLLTGATSSIHVASSTLHSAANSTLAFQTEDLEVKQGMHPTTGGDEAGMQEDRETISGGDYVAVGQHMEQIVVIYDSPLTMRNTDVTPPTASRRFPLMIGEVTEGEKKQERMKVVPHIGSPEVPQILKDSSKVTGGELVQGKCPVVQVRDFDYNSKQIFGIIIGNS